MSQQSPSRLPLTTAQTGLWYAQHLDAANPVYNIAQAVEITGELDIGALRAATRTMVTEAEVLHLRFGEDDDGPYQWVERPSDWNLDVVDLVGYDDSRAEVEERMRADLRTPRAVTDGALFTVVLYVLGPNRYVFYQRAHHLLIDGFSAVLLFGRLLDLYRAAIAGSSPTPKFFGTLRDLLDDEQRYLRSDKAEADRQFWVQHLAQVPPPVGLAAASSEPAYHLTRASDRIPAAAVDNVNAAVRAAGGTPAAAVLTAAALYLHRLTGSRHVTLGLPVTARREGPTNTVPSMLSNIVPLPIAIDPQATVGELLSEVRTQTRKVLIRQRYRYERLSHAHAPRLFGPTVNLLPVLDDVSLGAAKASMRNLSVGPVDDLSIIVHGFDDGRDAIVDFDGHPDNYDFAELEGHAARFCAMLGSLHNNLDTPVGSVAVVTGDEADSLLRSGTGQAFEITYDSVVAEFEATVDRQPRDVALVAAGERLTFAELDSEANRLGGYLREYGAGPGTTVAVHLPRDKSLPVALLAVLKTGAAYLPLDPAYPPDRLSAMLRDARPVITLTSNQLTPPRDQPVLLLDDDQVRRDVAARPGGRLTDAAICPAPDDLAYVIYTSGSTGRPKGVAVEHRSLLNLLQSHRRRMFAVAAERVGRRVRMAHTAGVSFDAAWDPILWMIAGHQLHIAGDDIRRDPQALVAWIRESGVDAVETTPSFAKALIEYGLLDRQSALSVLALGGEAVEEALWKRLANVEGLLAFNLYGPTETTVDSLMVRITGSGEPKLGSTVSNSHHYVLDACLQPAPVGVAGELYVAGASLARGYHNRPGLSAERFVADPFSADGTRMYRTGDLVRRNRSGDLEFLGRSDEQVKIRGVRVEPAEVENALASQSGVSQAAVVARGSGDRARLIGYVAGTDQLDTEELRRRLARQLPEYLVPAVVVVLDALPLTSNGKLDKTALPDPAPRDVTAGRPARDEAEERLAALFEAVLGVAGVGIDDNFFELGGHSLLVTRLVGRIREEWGSAPAIREVFEHPTVAELAPRLRATDATVPPLRPYHRNGDPPLSFAQRRLWFLNRFDPSSAEYNMPVALRMRGELDVAALRAACDDLVARHESLRTVFPWDDDAPRQHVLSPHSRADFAVEPCLEREVSQRVGAEAATGFDLTADVALRVRLFMIDNAIRPRDQEYVLLLVLHHIAGDGWSLAPLARDLSHVYRSRVGAETAPLPHLDVQYADYAMWQHEALGDETDPDSAMARQLAYWRETLADIPTELRLPTDRPRPAERDGRGARVELAINAASHAALVAMAHSRSASTFMTLHAAVAALLTRLGAGEDIPIGTPVAGRGDPALDELVGFFVNTVVLRTDTSGDPAFAELVNRVRRADLNAYAHQDAPFERVVEEIDPPRSATRHPLFQVMLALQNNADAHIALPGIDVEYDPSGEIDIAKFDLLFDLAEHFDTDGIPAGLTGSVEYSTALFDRRSAEDIAERFVRLLEHVTTDPQARISTAPLSAPDESAALANMDTVAGSPDENTILRQFAAQVKRTPEATAVVSGSQRWSFAELDAQSRAWAQILVELGAGPGQRVAVALPRSAHSVVALMAALRSGAAYVPLDINYPPQRLGHILADAAPRVLITGSHADVTVPSGTIEFNVDLPRPQPVPAPTLPDVTPDDLAYIAYTSGSTGKPKGVAVEHASLANLLAHHKTHVFLPERARVAHISGIAFDAAWDPILWMVCGHELHMIDDELRVDASALVAYLESAEIHAIETTPSYVRQLLTVGMLRAAHHPCHIALGGEAVNATLWSQLVEHPDVVAYNFYGPTEFTVDSVMTSTAADADPVIGRPVDGVGALVLDDQLRPVPTGVVGELYLTGAGSARGYLHRPESTATSFVADPTSTTGARMYRTGDLVSRRHDGALRFVGRADSQIKIRGFRVETGDVEAAVATHLEVDQAVVVAVEDTDAGHRLDAYVVTHDDQELDVGRLRDHMKATVPDYMVPSTFTAIASVPLTANGKLDRRALPAPRMTAGRGRQPRTDCERTLCTVIGEIVGAHNVSIDDDFFALGGHSLRAISLIGRIREELGVEIRVRTLFAAPTPAQLATEIARARPAQAPLVPRPRPQYPPLSYAQRRLWFLNRMDPDSADYNIVLPFRLTGSLDIAALERALADLVRRHEALRTVFPSHESDPYQLVLPADEAQPELRQRAVRTASEVADLLGHEARRGFDLTRQLPLRVMLIEVADNAHVLVVVMHHICGDGASSLPLARDLSRRYTARLLPGTVAPLEDLAVQYIDYTLWQRELLGDADDPDSLMSGHLDFWQRQLGDAAQEQALPADRRRPEATHQPADTTAVHIDAALHERLARFAREQSASLFMVLQAGLAALYTRLGAGEDIVLGAPVAGRNDPALADLVGFFVNTVALRTDTSGNPDFTRLLRRVQENDLDVFDHQDVPFEQVVERLQPERALGRHPVFQTLLTLQNTENARLELPGLRVEMEGGTHTAAAKYDLSFTFEEKFTDSGDPGGLRGTLEYNSAMFDAATAEQTAARLTRLLRAAMDAPRDGMWQLDILSPAERRHCLAAGRGPGAIDETPTVVDAFAAQARQTPRAAALVTADAELDFQTLDVRADSVAATLRIAGIGHGDVVAVAVPRSAHSIVGLLGVLKSGAAYLPIDVDYPDERIAAMLADARPAAALVTAYTSHRVSGHVRVIDVDEIGITDPRRCLRTAEVRPSDLAYVIYTSGSTGSPKGVEVGHASLAALFDSHRESVFDPARAKTGRQLRVAHTAGVGFDAAWDPVLWLIDGHQLHLVDDAVRRDPEALAAYCAAAGIDSVETTPGYARRLLRQGVFAATGVHIVALGGEAVDDELWRGLAEQDGVRAYNFYGPTESTVDSLIADIETHTTAHIGDPVHGTDCYVLDAALQPAPIGAVGELYLSGRGLAMGYRYRPDLTAQRFIANPYGAAGDRMYRTGDLVRRDRDGLLRFLGREDDQVKIRGFRVETAEIQTVLRRHPAVSDCAVAVRQASRDVGPQLTGYVVAPEDLDIAELRRHAARHLPDYMVPGSFVVIDSLPTTVNGKLDTSSLPRPKAQPVAIAPRSGEELAICALFAEILQLPAVSGGDNFFELGGHSLAAAELVDRIRHQLDVEVSISALFQAPTPAELAERITTHHTDSDRGLGRVLRLRATGTAPPLFAIHPGTGLAWGFANLLPWLGSDQPLYGLQAPGVSGRREELEVSSLTELVDGYIAAMRQVCPDGPYRLLGYSLGGNLAHAIAVRLQQLGEEVEMLVILDGYPSGPHEDFGAAGMWAALLDASGHRLAPGDNVDLESVRRAYQRHGDPLGELPVEIWEAIVASVDTITAMLRGRTPGRFIGDAICFRATRTAVPRHLSAKDWQPYIAGRVTEYDIDDDHWQMLRSESLRFVTEVLTNHFAAGGE